MTLDEIRDAWQIDCQIDINDLGTAAAIAPNLHSKYLNELITYKLRLTKIQNELIEFRIKKAKYFRGEMTKEELAENNWEQWQYRTLKSEIDSLIDADSQYQILSTRESYIKTVIYLLESIMSEIKARSFHVKNTIEWIRFRAGA